VLVLLHGLGANAGVWDGLRPFITERWPGRWIAPDLRGHGRSPHAPPYGFGMYAADVAELVSGEDGVTLLGHSLGGVVALALASGLFGVRVRRVVAFSVKVGWTDEARAKARALAEAPARTFDSREQAIDRYLRIAGLAGLVDPASPAAAAGVTGEQGAFRLAADPRTNLLDWTDFAALARLAGAPLNLLCGARDPVASPDAMRQLGADVTVLAGLGHNPHVEAPAAFWSAIEGKLASA
jgi:pimeloyl-ACP methyl ester carboxylesterase